MIVVWVATHFDGLLHGACRGVVVAADEAFVAGKACAWRNHTKVEGHHRLGYFENRSWRILAHQRAVEHRLGNVGVEFLVVLTAYAAHQQVGVVARGRHHGQNLARRWLDGHHTTAFVGHQLFGIRL